MKQNTILMIAGAMLLSTFHAYGQYPDSIEVPVTFYDFHSDRTNPEFEQPHDHPTGANNEVLPVTGMVAETLDSDGKPVPGNNPFLNEYIKYWFRDWEVDGGKGDSTTPLYNGNLDYKENPLSESSWEEETGTSPDYLGTEDIDHDTAFRNIVIEDTLIFRHIEGSNKYRFEDDSFFPLDGRGFGEEWNFAEGENPSYNFSFTMELKWAFTKEPDMEFSFTGDDDLWVFVNEELALDLGGIHEPVSGSFNLDNMAKFESLEDGDSCGLSIFYAERHSLNSHILIETNIITYSPTDLSLNAEPDDTISVGDTVTAWGMVLDDTNGVHEDLGDLINWEFVEDGNNPDSTLSTTTGDTVYFTPVKAGTIVRIGGTVQNPFTGGYLRDTLSIYVRAGEPAMLSIEPQHNIDPSNLELFQNPNPIENVVIGSEETTAEVYAILRDIGGNFVSHSENTDWSIESGTDIIESVNSGAQDHGEGIIYKAGPPGEGSIQALDTDYSLQDDADVTVEDFSYERLRILANTSTGQEVINELEIETAQDTMLIVQGYREDFGRWEPVSGDWTVTVPIQSIDMNSTESIQFHPTESDTGIIRVEYTGASSAEIPVYVSYGGPAEIEIHDTDGEPSDSSKMEGPPLYTTVKAGEPFDLYAKVFDISGQWLQEYNSEDSSSITWNLINQDAGMISLTSGFHTAFTGTDAGDSVYVVATIQEDGATHKDSVKFKIRPGDPENITVHVDTLDPEGNGISEVTLSPTDTVIALYPALKDQYGNFIDFATAAQWSSDDTSIVSAAKGPLNFNYGEGMVQRETDEESSTYIEVTDNSGTISNTVEVTISDIEYNDIRIVIYEGEYKPVDEITIRTDQDTMLYAQGKRSDNNKWVPLDVTWSNPEGLVFEENPPGLGQEWRSIPVQEGSGHIVITNRNNTASDSVLLNIISGLPDRLTINKGEEPPTPSNEMPPSFRQDTVTAGDTIVLSANLFDSRNSWLEEYRTPPESDDINWNVVEVNGNNTGNLINSSGGVTGYAPTVAFNEVLIIADYNNSSMIRDTARLFITPGDPDHLVIEASSNVPSKNQDDPAGLIRISSRDTVSRAYAVIRDELGNFVSLSSSTEWRSFDSSVVTAEEGVDDLGEGLIYREAKSGGTYITASNRNNTSLRDTAEVELLDIYYDSLMIVDKDGNDIYNLNIKTGKDTVLYVEGRRSDKDDVWERVNANWYSEGIRVSTSAPSQSTRWDFTAVAMSSGNISVRMGDATDQIPVNIDHGDPSDIEIYNATGDPGLASVELLPPPDQTIQVNAGNAFDVAVKVFDKNENWLPMYEDSASLFSWRLSNNRDTAAELEKETGVSNSVTPVKAYNEVTLEVSFGRGITDRITLNINPGEADHVVIEGSQDAMAHPNSDNPIDTVTITSVDDHATVYAILRDALGNFVSHSEMNTWESSDNTVFTAEVENPNNGSGTLSRVDSSGAGIVTVTNTNPDLSLSSNTDDAVVVLREFYYTELRIVDVNLNTFEGGILPEITTNDDQALVVQGLNSSTNEWEIVKADWEITDSLTVTPAPPEQESEWTFSPDVPGSGIIIVSHDNDSTIPDTLNVTFTPGEPEVVNLEITTPPSERRAGEPMDISLEIKNEDGRVPGTWCGSTVFGDLLEFEDMTDINGDTLQPSVLIDGDTIPLDSAQNLCFNDGISEIELLLYKVPEEGDLHEIAVDIVNGNEEVISDTAVTDINPGTVADIYIEKAGNPVTGTVEMSYGGESSFSSIGVDSYNNLIGPVKTRWYSDSAIPEVEDGENTAYIYYRIPVDILREQNGYLTAELRDAPEINDSVQIRITPKPPEVITAETRDSNGNGLLDGIYLEFDAPAVNLLDLDLSSGFNIPITVETDDKEFTVDSISLAEPGDSTGFILHIVEDDKSEPQTAWTPEVTIDGVSGTRDGTYTTEDKAGPVVWYVKEDSEIDEDDVVTITFSEELGDSSSGGSFDWGSTPPSEVLNVWFRADTGFEKIDVDSLFQGTDKFTGKEGRSLTIKMTNGYDINSNHYFSINPEGGLSDLDRNVTVEDNKPRITHEAGKIGDIAVGPNPLVPTYKYYEEEKDQEATPLSPPEAFSRVNENGGTVIEVTLKQGYFGNMNDSIQKIEGVWMVFDGIGNMVRSSKKNANLVSDERASFLTAEESDSGDTNIKLYFYWDGITDQGRPASPGAYRLIVVFNYHFIGGGKKAEKFTSIVGVKK